MPSHEAYNNSKPADKQLIRALLPGEVHATPNTDHPHYHEMQAQGKFAGPSEIPNKRIMPDDYEFPPSTRTVTLPKKG